MVVGCVDDSGRYGLDSPVGIPHPVDPTQGDTAREGSSQFPELLPIQVTIPENNKPDGYKNPDQLSSDRQLRTIGERDPNIEGALEQEEPTNPRFPVRSECVDELAEWEKLRDEANTVLENFAAKIQHERAIARQHHRQPPVSFTYDIQRDQGMVYVAQGLGVLIQLRIENAGWTMTTHPLANGDLRITIA